MNKVIRIASIFASSFLFLFVSNCKKETILVSDNDAPTINNVPAIKIENYINRVFIDLLGREPLDSEMAAELNTLKNENLSKEAREALFTKLQSGTDFITGDTSYTHAYHQYLYNLAKIRCLEGASDAAIKERINGANDPAEILKLQKVLSSRADFLAGDIQYHDMFARMIYNDLYDQINMNSFNFVNATFDNLLWRFPTNAEFNEGYTMVEFNNSGSLFGQIGQNKQDYVQIITSSAEMFEGLIIFAFQQLVSRRPTTEETASLLADFIENKDFKIIQRQIMATDEYANF